jgi:hypothetical protein
VEWMKKNDGVHTSAKGKLRPARDLHAGSRARPLLPAR